MCDIADAASDVHRPQALDEAVIVVGMAAVMQLTDAGDVVAAFAQGVGPTLDMPIIGDGVVPGAVTVHREPGCKTGPRRDADRRRCVGGGEAATTRGKRVQRRCGDDRVPGIPAILRLCSSDMMTSRFWGLGDHRCSSRPDAGRSYKPFPRSGSELFVALLEGQREETALRYSTGCSENVAVNSGWDDAGLPNRTAGRFRIVIG